MGTKLTALKYIGYNTNGGHLNIIGKIQPIEESGTKIILCLEENNDYARATQARRVIDFSEHCNIQYWFQVSESPTKTESEFRIYRFYPIKIDSETEKFKQLFAKHF